MNEQEQRAAFVEAARGWLGTPYHHMGRIRGVGVDCATLIAEAACEAGLIDPLVLPPYTTQWNLNQSDESYLAVIRKYMREFEGPPLPGDLVVWKFGRTYSHGAIVIKWPLIIHAVTDQNVCYDNAETNLRFARITEKTDKGRPRPRLFFSAWGHE